jgi:hypothetical protein
MRNAVVDWTLASTDWAEMGLIIEREDVSIQKKVYYWEATVGAEQTCSEQGTTPLIAAARCYVASKLGDVVDIPKELV